MPVGVHGARLSSWLRGVEGKFLPNFLTPQPWRRVHAPSFHVNTCSLAPCQLSNGDLLTDDMSSVLGSSGAIIAIVALALGPFAQQVATYRTRMVLAKEPATIPTALNYTGVLPGKSSSSMASPFRTSCSQRFTDLC